MNEIYLLEKIDPYGDQHFVVAFSTREKALAYKSKYGMRSDQYFTYEIYAVDIDPETYPD